LSPFERVTAMKVLANAGSEDTIHLVVVAIVTVLLEWFVCRWNI